MTIAEPIVSAELVAWPFQIACALLLLCVVVLVLRLIRQRRVISFSREQLRREAPSAEHEAGASVPSSRPAPASAKSAPSTPAVARDASRTHASSREMEYETLLNSVPLGVAVLDTNFMYSQCNGLMGSIFGLDSQDLVGQHVFETFAGSNQDVDFYPGNWCRTTRRASQAVLDMLRSNGQRLVANLYVAPMFSQGDSGDIVGYLQVVEDITLRLESQEQIARTTRLATAQSRQFRSMLLGCKEKILLEGAQVATISVGEGGSDFVEFVRYDEKHLDVLMGTSGESPESKLLSASVKSVWMREICNTLLSTQGTMWPTPGELLGSVQESLNRRPLAGAEVRLAHLRVDLKAGRLVRGDMGHHATLLYRSTEGLSTRLEAPNESLPHDDLPEQIGHDLQAGDVLLVVSPQVIELTNSAKEALGVMRLGELLETLSDLPPREMLMQIRTSLEEFSGGRLSQGAMMSAICLTGETERCAKLSEVCKAHADVSNLPEFRAAVCAICAEAPPVDPMAVTHLELAVSEVVTNIASQIDDEEMIELCLDRYDDSLVAEMRYPGRLLEGEKAVPEVTGEGTQEFGLLIVRNCVDEIEFHYGPDGRAVVRLTKRI
ncbi:MAG: PAS domain S-box protein [Phycisphaerales bacterium]|jgi:PAS domain S-box-containing protein|nr:PAS domain S-box protein [Phycisphaerales bacterium]MBT7172000.1 PAS domain S-box protein [Phycisphaerales bacterium]